MGSSDPRRLKAPAPVGPVSFGAPAKGVPGREFGVPHPKDGSAGNVPGTAGGFSEAPQAAFVARRTPLAPPEPLSPETLGLLSALKADGQLTESAFLDLAGHAMGLGRISLGLVPPDRALTGLLDPRTCLRHAMIPWRRDGATLLVATARPETAGRLDKLLPGRLLPARAVLAPREEVQRHILRRHRARIVAAMASRTPEAESCRSWSRAPRTRMAVLGLLAGLLLLVAALAPGPAFLALTFWAVFTLVVAMSLKIAATTAHLIAERRLRSTAPHGLSEDPGPRAAADDLPRISIIVPLFRERRIAETLIRRLQTLDYPRDRLDIVLTLEETDRTTAEAVANIDLPPWMRVVTAPDGIPRTKPRAMNFALDFCEGDIVGIYDAEDAPEADQLLKVARHFARAPAEVACLQGVLDYYNPRQTWIARCFTIEYATWFRLLVPGMTALGLAVPLGGTTLFVRREVLERIGAWDAHNVTEDADLGFRLARHGYRTEVLASVTREEAACHVLPWVRQRSRWLKGYVVTYLVHMRRPLQLLRQLGPWRFLGFQAHFVTALSQFFLSPMLLSCWLLIVGLPHPLANAVSHPMLVALSLLFLASEVLNMTLGWIATRGAQHRHLAKWVPSLHLYFPLGCAAAYKALFELVVNPFYWDKTPHGHSLRMAARRGVRARLALWFGARYDVSLRMLSGVVLAAVIRAFSGPRHTTESRRGARRPARRRFPSPARFLRPRGGAEGASSGGPKKPLRHRSAAPPAHPAPMDG